MSWVVVSKETGVAVWEFFDKRTAAKINRDAYDVVEAGAYLEALNAAIKIASASARPPHCLSDFDTILQ